MQKNKRTKKYPSPFLKWAGGKSQLLSQYDTYFPKKYGNYFEPFMGGGAVFFHLKPENAFLSDYNEELINCYIQIRDNPEKVMELLKEHRKNHDKLQEDYYYLIREMAYDQLDDIGKAARTIYLNKTCYNGLYRLNSMGQFNVPFGRYKNPGIFDSENFMAVSKILKKVRLEVMDYREIIHLAKSGDFIYFDPPYHPLSETSSFTGYTELSFKEEDQRNLSKLFHQLDNKGCLVMHSNSDTELIRSLYTHYKCKEIKANRFINSKVEGRKAISELLILNFDKNGRIYAKERKRGKSKRKSKYWDPWEKLFTNHVDREKTVNHISAETIKKETGMEPRLMAKFDTRRELPPVFRDNNAFLLPVSNGKYVVVSGEGYHDLEEPPVTVENFRSDIPFDLKSIKYARGEMRYIDYAFNSGLISHFTGVDNLFLTVRGRKFSGKFSFHVNDVEIPEVSSVQMEIDAGYEGQNELIIIEAKVGKPSSFNIRQLFYPFRHYSQVLPDKKIRPVFFVYQEDKKENNGGTYYFYEYNFTDIFDYNSIEPVSIKAYRYVKPEEQDGFTDLFPETTKIGEKKSKNLYIPQANDIDKIMEFPFRIAEGMDNAREIAEYFEFTKRQSSYYREAVQNLGFADMRDKNRYVLTPLGKRFVNLPVEKRNKLLCREMMNLPILKEIMTRLYERKSLSMNEIAKIIEKNSDLSGQTPKRRTGTLRAWFWWLYIALGIVKVGRESIFI
ncbi:MAG: DNA adenine methylase [Candidatus Eremiobacteraeota bacterium]|nr:DNA adenine methylase [Candidatus Eremiobacteraeota bacterium]